MNNKIIPAAALLLICLAGHTQTIQWTSGRPDGHAPISKMGDHYHTKGQWMFSYRYMVMGMKGNLDGSDKTSNEAIYENYMVAPQKMTMQMHMLGAMYAPCNAVTLMLMGQYIHNRMDLRTKTGTDFMTSSGGFGDLSLSGLLKIFNKNRQSLHAIIGLSIPTGNINQRDNTPMMTNARLAYPMQLGSGTWDPLAGITYLGQSDIFSWGAQAKYTFRTGKNKQDYRLGNTFYGTAWGAVKASDYISFSGSLTYTGTDKISGADPGLMPMMMPLFNTANSGRSQLDAGIGSNFYIPKGPLKDLRIAAEVNLPVVQHVNGTQMKNNIGATIGVQYTLAE